MSCKEVFDRHGYDCGRVDRWLEYVGAEDSIRPQYEFAEMRGIFRWINGKLRFIPDSSGKAKAITMAVYDDDRMVDIIAFRKGAPDWIREWGCVTGNGRFLNRHLIVAGRDKPLRVAHDPVDWLRNPDSVLWLAGKMSELQIAGDLVVDTSTHALQLLYEAFIFPAPHGHEAQAKALGRKHIWIDDGQPAKVMR